MASISVVIPCYNEEASIGEVIAQVPPGVLEIVVIDNNSTDKTAAIAAAAGARVVAEPKQGYGPALMRGFAEARGDLIATVDGDNQYPAFKIVDIANWLEKENLDFVSAARLPLDDKHSMPLIRRVGNWGLTLAANIIFNLRLHDAQSGMWVFKKSVLDLIPLEQGAVGKGMSLTQEIKLRAAKNPNIRFAEYHIPYAPRLGHSKLNPWRDGWRMLTFMIGLRFRI